MDGKSDAETVRQAEKAHLETEIRALGESECVLLVG